MRCVSSVLVRLCAIAALALVGGACSNVTTPRVLPDQGGAWFGWQNVDEGGFEEMGTVNWHDGLYGTAHAGSAKVVAPGYSGKAGYQANSFTQERVNYEFYAARAAWKWLFPHRTFTRISASGNVANLVALDQAAASGGTVHVSGRQMSGLSPGAAYVEVMRVTPVKRPVRIAY